MPLDATEVLKANFLTVRARLIDLAAAIDRIDRAEGSLQSDPRRKQIQQALELLCSHGPERTERVQAIFSLPYCDGWQAECGLKRKAAPCTSSIRTSM
jgi:hypothetical protein